MTHYFVGQRYTVNTMYLLRCNLGWAPAHLRWWQNPEVAWAKPAYIQPLNAAVFSPTAQELHVRSSVTGILANYSTPTTHPFENHSPSCKPNFIHLWKTFIVKQRFMPPQMKKTKPRVAWRNLTIPCSIVCSTLYKGICSIWSLKWTFLRSFFNNVSTKAEKNCYTQIE